MNNGSTSMVQVQDDMGRWRDVTEKISIKEAIMEGTKKKYRASFDTPFMQPPLNLDLRYVRKGRSAEEVLMGTYEIPKPRKNLQKSTTGGETK
jgi:hypothetical protein